MQCNDSMDGTKAFKMAGTRPVVMVVCEDAAMRDALRFMLDQEGAGTILYGGGEEALASGQASRTGCMILPERLGGMDGFALLKRLRAQGGVAPVILLTSRVSAALRARAWEESVWLVLEKPILDDALLNAVSAALAGLPPPVT